MFPLVVNKLLNASHKLDVLNGKISLANRFLRTRLITLRGRRKPRKKKKKSMFDLDNHKKNFHLSHCVSPKMLHTKTLAFVFILVN